MINLLPSKEKKALIQEENWKIVLILGFLVLIFLISLVLILLSIKISISGQVESQKIFLNQPYPQDLQKMIETANQNLSKLNSFYQGQIYLTKILERISINLPPKTYLTSFSYQKERGQITLLGFAPTREILLEFKKSLEKEKDFAEIYFPAQNWFKPIDIDFSVTFKITP